MPDVVLEIRGGRVSMAISGGGRGGMAAVGGRVAGAPSAATGTPVSVAVAVADADLARLASLARRLDVDHGVGDQLDHAAQLAHHPLGRARVEVQVLVPVEEAREELKILRPSARKRPETAPNCGDFRRNHLNPGGMPPGGMPPPGMLRMSFFMPPFDIFFIIFSICRCCLRRRFTSWICWPDPAAMRFLREPRMISGRIVSQQLDRSKPLWELHVIDGIRGRKFAAYLKLHP